VIFLASVASAACDLPGAVFDGGTSNGGSTTTSHGGSTDGGSAGQTTATHGGSGGTGGSMGTAGSSTAGAGGDISTTTAMGGAGGGPFMGPVVLCAPNKTPCEAYEVCCLYPDNPGDDRCDQPNNCGGAFDAYEEFACDGPEDCPGAHCCVHFDLYQAHAQCKPSCLGGADDYTMCTDGSQCTAPQKCYYLLIGYDYAVCADPP